MLNAANDAVSSPSTGIVVERALPEDLCDKADLHSEESAHAFFLHVRHQFGSIFDIQLELPSFHTQAVEEK
jgi:hypothetical protein